MKTSDSSIKIDPQALAPADAGPGRGSESSVTGFLAPQSIPRFSLASAQPYLGKALSLPPSLSLSLSQSLSLFSPPSCSPSQLHKFKNVYHKTRAGI